MRPRRALADRRSRHPTRRAVRCWPACPARSVRPRRAPLVPATRSHRRRPGRLARRRRRATRSARVACEVLAQRVVDRLRSDARAGRRPRQPRRRRGLVGDDVLRRLQVARLASQAEGDQHPEGRPEGGHQGRRDTLHVVVLARRHDRPYHQPGAEGDQHGERRANRRRAAPPAVRSASPCRLPTAGFRWSRTAAACPGRRSTAPDR